MTKTSNSYLDYYSNSASEKGPHLLIIAGVHGDEFEPMIAATNLVKRLQNKNIKGKVTILPIANIIAYDIGKRCGTDQLDLARTLPGRENGSITEKIAKSVSELIHQADYLIDLHTGGALFDLMPLTGYLLHPDKDVLAKQKAMAKAFNLPLIWGTDATAQGRTLSIARDNNIPAIYAECRGGLHAKTSTIKLYEEGCLNVMKHLNMLNASFNMENPVIWLEDYTPGQGHLQTKLPAPDNGIFVPALHLGEKVKKGTELGYIINPVMNKKTKIIIEEEGILFMLRISSRVSMGESLGGVLPVSRKGKKTVYAK
jgi:predicted deacylase